MDNGLMMTDRPMRVRLSLPCYENMAGKETRYGEEGSLQRDTAGTAGKGGNNYYEGWLKLQR